MESKKEIYYDLRVWLFIYVGHNDSIKIRKTIGSVLKK